MSNDPTTVTIATRYAGPPSSGNGGYTAGLLASHLTGLRRQPVTVTLRRPPPLDTAMSVLTNGGDDTARLMAGQDLVAEAGPGSFSDEAVEPVSLGTARAAEAAYRGLTDHPFPRCFVCGPARAEGDGLRLRPGLVAPGRTACVWTPHLGLADDVGDVPEVFGWSALDCPGGWTSDLDARPLVLGRMTAVCDPVRTGTSYVVVGRLLGEDGRKTFTASAVYDVTDDEVGRLVGRAEQVWIAIDPGQFS